jgi:hypothetical protein
MQQGMTWWQAMLTILLGNVIVLLPMILNAHAGTKYGVSFPVLCRAAFGVRGANLPALLRALVACGWFGIQTWIGALALNTLLIAAWPAWMNLTAGIWISFAIFWAIQVWIICNGLEGIKKLEGWSAPLLLGGGALLLGWAIVRGGGLGHILSESVRLQTSHVPFWRLFPAALTANVGYWATLSLNIPDFTRYARSQRSQALGQGARFAGDDDRLRLHRRGGDERDDRAVRRSHLGSGCPHRAHRQRASDHLRRARRPARAADDEHGSQRRLARKRFFQPGAPAHQLRDRRPHHRRHRRRHAAVEALCGCRCLHLYVAHRILESDGRHRRHSHRRLLGLRRRELSPVDLFKLEGRYTYSGGVNPRAVIALVIAVLPVIPGFLRAATTPGGTVANPTFLDSLYTYAWFVTFGLSFTIYLALARTTRCRRVRSHRIPVSNISRMVVSVPLSATVTCFACPPGEMIGASALGTTM